MSTEIYFGNKLYAHLASGITSGQTTIPIVPGEIGNVWRGFKPGVHLYLTLVNELGQIEIVKVTGIVNNTLTVVRGQDGTTARAYAIGSPMSARVTAAELGYMIQAGQFRQGNFNPNTVLTGDWRGEKFWQAGPAADQKRWWINAYGDKWRLLTGTLYGNEYRDGEGFIIQPPGWTYAAPLTDHNGPMAITEYNGAIYVGSNSEGDLLWFDTDWLYEVAPYIFPVEGVNDFCKFSVDGKLYAAMPRRRLYQWNGTDAWTEIYNGGAGTGYLGLVELSNKLYMTATGTLQQWDGAMTQKAPALGSDTIEWTSCLIVMGGEIYALSSYGSGSSLLKWNGVNAWTRVATKYGTANRGRSLITVGGKIYASIFDNSGNNYFVEWNGADAWILRGTTSVVIQNLTTDGTNVYCLVTISGVETLYKWDGVNFTGMDIPNPTDPTENDFRKVVYFEGVFYATNGYGLYTCMA